MPAHAAWFDSGAVHALEQPLLAGGSGTPPTPPLSEEAYREVRGAIMQAYRRVPERPLTCGDAVAAAGASAEAAPRVWAFLDSWGFINHLALDHHSADADTADQSGAGAAKLFSFPVVTAAAGQQAAMSGGDAATPLMPHSEVPGTTPLAPLVRRRRTDGRHGCAARPWVDCTAARHRCTAAGLRHLALCPQSFAEGRLPAGTSARDFAFVQGPAPPPAGEEWTEQETLLLLEGVEVYGEAWPRIAAHVGSKPSFKCAMRFLQLPIEDGVMEAAAQPAQGAGAEAVQSGGSAEVPAPPLPFGESENPIMAQVAFLTAVVASPVAAAAAQRALQVLSGSSGDPGEPFPAGAVQTAARAGLQAAAVKAKLLADAEERNVLLLVRKAAEAQAEVVRLKTAAAAATDVAVRECRAGLATRTASLNAERAALQASPLPVLEAPKPQPAAPPPQQTEMQALSAAKPSSPGPRLYPMPK